MEWYPSKANEDSNQMEKSLALATETDQKMQQLEEAEEEEEPNKHTH